MPKSPNQEKKPDFAVYVHTEAPQEKRLHSDDRSYLTVQAVENVVKFPLKC
jgi:hypothetical protein